MEITKTLAAIDRMLARGPGDGSTDFDLNPEIKASWPTPQNLRPAVVLIPLIERANGVNIILTKRASHLKHHPGQIAFPGGKVDPSDVNETAAALREADEEIGLKPDNVRVLGHLPFHGTVTHFQITPVLGLVKAPFAPNPEPGEVAEVFEVPLSYLLAPENYLTEGRFWGGTKRFYHVIPFGPYYIWGATARILFGFAERMAK